jgi:hypothetical protein
VPTRPNWRVNEVYGVLIGMDGEHADVRFVDNSQHDVTDVVKSARFACGCVVSDDGGWESCGEGLHAALAAVKWNSGLTKSFRQARSAFDAVLAEAWERRGLPPEAYFEFQRARQREFTTFDRWKTAHDLLGESIWKSGYLQADLRDVPLSEDIRLSRGTGDLELLLEWRKEHGNAICLPFSAEAAVLMVFVEG